MSARPTRDIVLADACNQHAPLNFRVVVHGEGEKIGSLTFERPWTYMNIAMSRADLERVSHAINEALEATSVPS
jgi:hypothetical protein